MPESVQTTHEIPGWDRLAWAVSGHKDGAELVWQREASVDATYTDGGVEETFAPERVHTDQVALGEGRRGRARRRDRYPVRHRRDHHTG